jgi:hypothetical protein
MELNMDCGDAQKIKDGSGYQNITPILSLNIRKNILVTQLCILYPFRGGGSTAASNKVLVHRDSEVYNMNHFKRGRAVVFNHEVN